MTRTVSLSALAVAAMMATAPAAQAGGWIAQNIVKPIAGKKAADKLDKWHKDAGKPLDAVAKAAEEAAKAAAAAAAGKLLSK